MADDFDARVAGVALLHDPIRRSLYEYVVGTGSSVSREEAADAVGVQKTLAAFHLDKLADGGLLDVEFRRLSGRTGPGAGRPAKLYRRSGREVEVSLPPREYDLAAWLLAAAIEDVRSGGAGAGDVDVDVDVRAALRRRAHEMGRAIGEAVERRAGGARASGVRRREALLAELRSHGFEPRVVGREVVLGNCPFHRLAREFTDLVCGMNHDLMTGVREAMGAKEGVLAPRLEPEDGVCCVRFAPA